MSLRISIRTPTQLAADGGIVRLRRGDARDDAMRAVIERNVEVDVGAEVLLVDEPACETPARGAGAQCEVLGAPADGKRTAGGLREAPSQGDAQAREPA